MLQCAAVCCSVLQCVAVCCSVLQSVAVCCSVLQSAAACCSVLQCVHFIAVCCIIVVINESDSSGTPDCRQDGTESRDYVHFFLI